MHYKIDYAGLPKEEKRIKAWYDATQWWTPKQMDAIVQVIDETFARTDLTGREKIRQMKFWVEFTGIKGYPAKAIIRTVWMLRKVW